MNKQDLITSASRLRQPSTDSSAEFSAKMEDMAAAINARFKSRKDLSRLIGKDNYSMMCDNHRNHLRFMSSLFTNYDPAVFTETVIWVFRAYTSHGFSLTYWPAQLNTWTQIFKETLSDSCYQEIYPFYHWMIVNNPAFVALSEGTAPQGPPPGHSKHQ